MTTQLTEATAREITQSWRAMQLRRRPFAAAMARYLTKLGSNDMRNGGDAALAITDMLFDHTRELAGKSPAPAIEQIARRHHSLGITGDQYSSFGDGLGAIMKDVLRLQAAPTLLSAWGDAYWAIAGAVRRQARPLAA